MEYVETSPSVSRLNHVRIITFMAVLLAMDIGFLQHAITHTIKSGPSVLLLFGFEYVILASRIVTTFVKYLIFTVDNWLDGRDAQPALIGRHYITERDSAPVQYNGIV